jgi:hypothetical protein
MAADNSRDRGVQPLVSDLTNPGANASDRSDELLRKRLGLGYARLGYARNAATRSRAGITMASTEGKCQVETGYGAHCGRPAVAALTRPP